jgi:hypothetical protein
MILEISERLSTIININDYKFQSLRAGKGVINKYYVELI